MARVIRVKGGAMEGLLMRLEELEKTKLKIGVFESAKYEDGTPVAGVAAVQELGSPKMGIPPRPFFRTTAEEKKGEWGSLFERASKAIVEGKISPYDAMDRIGLQVAGQIKTTITNIQAPPLSPVTLHLRKLKQQGETITGSIVAGVKQKAAKGEELDTSGVSTKPLVDDAILLNSITHAVEET